MKAKFVLCLLFFGALFNMNNAKATVYTWLNAAGGGWDTPANWGTGLLNLTHGVPVAGDTAILPDLLIAYTVTLNSATSCTNIIASSLLSYGVTLNTNGKTLNVSGDVSVGTSTILSATLFNIVGSGAVTLNQVDVGQPLGFIGQFNLGSATDKTTNVTIAGSNVSLYGPIILLGAPSSINNYGSLTITGSNVNFYYFGQLNNYGTGTVTTNTSNYNLTYYGATVNNYGTFNVNSATVTNTNFNLTNYSDYINNYGTFNAGIYPAAATITLNGTNIGINNASTTVGSTTYNGAFNLGSTSVIYPSSTTATVVNGTNDVFTIMSDANGSGTIGQVTAGATLTGLYNVQRYITGNNSLSYRSYRLFSSPVNLNSYLPSASGTNYISLNTLNSTYTVNGTKYYGAFTGGPGTGFSVSNPNPTIYFFKEPLPTSNTSFTSGKNQGVKSIFASQVTLFDNITYNIPVGNGYILFFIGSTLNRTTGSSSLKPDNATITNVGYLNQQTIPLNLWYTPTKGALKLSAASTTTFIGYNMVGNPYASTIDLKLLYNDNKDATVGVSPNFYVLNTSNQYVSYNAQYGTTSGTGSSQYIASGQGFFVVANSNTSVLNFKETYKPTTVTNPSPILLSLKNLAVNNAAPTGAAKSLSVKNDAAATTLSGLHMKLSADSITYDECGIYYNSIWSDNFDNNDASALGGISPRVSVSSLTADGYHVGINALGAYTNGKKVRVSVKATTDGNYNIQMEDIFNIDTVNYTVSLIDNFSKDSVKLVPTKNYAFTITNADTSTWGDNRFVLSIEKKPLPPYQLASFTGQKATDGVLLNWKTINEGTYTAFEIQKQDAGNSQYNAIYDVMGDGSGSYVYTDKNTVIGNNTYRLMQTDIHKNVTYSNPITIVYNPTVAAGALSVYPNPAVAQITVNFNAATNNSAMAGPETYTASIYSINGAVMMQKSLSTNTWSPNVSDLKPGAYIVEIRSGDGSLIGNSKFMKHP